MTATSGEAPKIVACAKCGIGRKDFVIGTVDDRCPDCGFKEGCCD